MDWRHGALCRGTDGELWFPIDEDKGRASAGVRAAKAACAGCPVRAECLTWALDSGQGAGVWGGLSTPERRALRTPQRAAVTAAAAAERRAREDALAAVKAAQGGDQEPAQPRPRRPRVGPHSGSPRSKRWTEVGHCGTCGKRVDLRRDGTPVRHDRNTARGFRECEGVGQPLAQDAPAQ